MRYSSVPQARPSRQNNFNMLRMIAALCVMSGHMSKIADVETVSFGGVEVHNVGVIVLFLIGGYLIAKSWLSDPHPAHYAAKRFVRLWPPLAVFTLSMTFIAGPLISQLGPKAYFQSEYWVFLRNLRLYITFYLPGVFSEELEITNVVNGSLWTIPVEAVLYIVCPLLLYVCGRQATKTVFARRVTIIAGVALLLELLRKAIIPDARLVLYATEWLSAWYLIASFLIGMAYACLDIERLLNLQVAILVMMLFGLVSFGPALQGVIAIFAIAYFVFSFSLTEKPLFSGFFQKYELSYGIYLYSFFFQQLAAWIFNIELALSLSCMQLFFISLIPTLGASWLSCVLVEKPLIRLTNWLIAKHTRSREIRKILKDAGVSRWTT